MAMAGEGPIVIVNSTKHGSDVIIVTNSAIKSLALPGLIYEDVNRWMRRISRELVRGKARTYPSRNEEMEMFLLWLWDVAVAPIFEDLQLNTTCDEDLQDHTACDDNNLTHIWWIGVGLLAKAPFHAAGDHAPGSTRNTISRAISSYIPTIKSLSYARERKLELLGKPDSRLLLVTMPTTPGKRPLKNATLEAERIASAVEGKTIPTLLDSPSSAEVLENLPPHHAVHFACHGVSDGVNPSNSHLLLCKDNQTD